MAQPVVKAGCVETVSFMGRGAQMAVEGSPSDNG